MSWPYHLGGGIPSRAQWVRMQMSDEEREAERQAERDALRSEMKERLARYQASRSWHLDEPEPSATDDIWLGNL